MKVNLCLRLKITLVSGSVLITCILEPFKVHRSNNLWVWLFSESTWFKKHRPLHLWMHWEAEIWCQPALSVSNWLPNSVKYIRFLCCLLLSCDIWLCVLFGFFLRLVPDIRPRTIQSLQMKAFHHLYKFAADAQELRCYDANFPTKNHYTLFYSVVLRRIDHGEEIIVHFSKRNIFFKARNSLSKKRWFIKWQTFSIAFRSKKYILGRTFFQLG